MIRRGQVASAHSWKAESCAVVAGFRLFGTIVPDETIAHTGR